MEEQWAQVEGPADVGASRADAREDPPDLLNYLQHMIGSSTMSRELICYLLLAQQKGLLAKC